MFRASQCLIKKVAAASAPVGRSFATYKTSTGLVGLAVDVNGRETLLDLAASIKETVKGVPATSQYRINVEKWFTYIGSVAEGTQDIKKIEDEIAMGQIEELIEMAKDELELVQIYIDEKGWVQVAEEQKDAEALVADMKDSIYFTNPLPPPPADDEAKK